MKRSLLYVLICISLLNLGCDYLFERRIWSHKDEYIGHYKLNAKKSELSIYSDSLQYQNLELYINSDTTFQFSIDVPFIKEFKGKWRMGGDDMTEWCVLMYSNGAEDQVGRENEREVIIRTPRRKLNAKSVEVLYLYKLSNMNSQKSDTIK